MRAIWSIGECMLELQGEDGRYRSAFAGDAYNTAVYLKRALPERQVAFISALGRDLVSQRMRAAWRDQGIDDGLCESVADRLPGLYMIQLDPAGERSFLYWRESSAARTMLGRDQAARLRVALGDCGLIYFSGISLAILDAARRDTLYRLLEEARAQDVLVAFDPNVRPALWPDAESARTEILRAGQLAGIVLPTADDMPFLGLSAEPAAIAQTFGAGEGREVAVKLGAEGAEVFGQDAGGRVPGDHGIRAVDTTGAGDAFNAGYLAARLRGATPEAAARRGNALAAQVIQAPGAIVPREVTAEVLAGL